jgi:hypothetical protein
VLQYGFCHESWQPTAGKYLVWLSRQAEETPANKKLANQITRRWAAPLFAAGREYDEEDAEQQRYIYQQRKQHETEVSIATTKSEVIVKSMESFPSTLILALLWLGSCLSWLFLVLVRVRDVNLVSVLICAG